MMVKNSQKSECKIKKNKTQLYWEMESISATSKKVMYQMLW